MVAPVAAAAAPVASSAAKDMLLGIVSNLVAGLATQGADRLLFRPAGEALGPSSYATANPSSIGKYFTGDPAQQLAVQQYLATEQTKRAVLEKIGLGGLLPPLPTAEQIIGGYRDGEFTGPAALREAQAKSLTRREIEKTLAEKRFDYAARLAESQASIERQRLQSLADAQARVEAQKVTSLGDVQRQRVESQYGAAGDLLESAIKNIAFRDKIEAANTLTELARAV